MTMASNLKIRLGSYIRNLRLDYDMKNDHFGFLSIRLLILTKRNNSINKYVKWTCMVPQFNFRSYLSNPSRIFETETMDAML